MLLFCSYKFDIEIKKAEELNKVERKDMIEWCRKYFNEWCRRLKVNMWFNDEDEDGDDDDEDKDKSGDEEDKNEDDDKDEHKDEDDDDRIRKFKGSAIYFST
jgi:hypothetical protein